MKKVKKFLSDNKDLILIGAGMAAIGIGTTAAVWYLVRDGSTSGYTVFSGDQGQFKDHDLYGLISVNPNDQTDMWVHPIGHEAIRMIPKYDTDLDAVEVAMASDGYAETE